MGIFLTIKSLLKIAFFPPKIDDFEMLWFQYEMF